MRVFMLAAVVVTVGVPSPARADGIVEVAGAVTFPIGDDNWKNTVEPSPELGIRAGGGNDELAGLIGLAWVPEQLDAQPAFTSVSGHRFRILGNLELGHHIAPKIRLGGRIGAGTDITHGSYTVMFAGTTASKSDTDFGFALDLAVSLLFDVGSVQVGPELAMPIGYHSKKAMNLGDLSFDYTQTDIELWFVVRFGSHAK